MKNTKKLKKEIYNIVINELGYEDIFGILQENKERATFNFFIARLTEEFKVKFNVNHISNILPKYKNYSGFTFNISFSPFGGNSILSVLKEIYTTDIRNKNLLLAEALINACISTLNKYEPTKITDFLEVVNFFSNKLEFYYDYDNRNFYNMEDPNISEFKNISETEKIKYKTCLDNYKEAKNLIKDEYYSQSITESLKSLESLLKAILSEKGIEPDTNFSKNIKKLVDINFFRDFKVQTYFDGLGCVRNKNSGHGAEMVHENNPIVSTFYHNNVGNAILFIIKMNRI